MTETLEERIAREKVLFLEYYAKLPQQKLAAGSIARDEDTILRWKKEDADFADRMIKARSQWAKEHVAHVHNSEWLLERLLRDEFKPPTQPIDLDATIHNNVVGLPPTVPLAPPPETGKSA